MDGFQLPPIPDHTLHPAVQREAIKADEIVSEWLAKLQDRFDKRSFNDLSELFLDDCWWRDIVALSWNFTSKRGQQDMAEYLTQSTSPLSSIRAIQTGGLKALVVDLPGMIWVQGGFTFQTPHGTGKGLVKLLNVGETEWKAWIAYTQLEELNFQADLEKRNAQNPAAAARDPRVNPVDSGENDGLQVLIVGAGQAGLALGARLKSMGIKTLLVERHSRLGGSWRARYKSVTLNTPTYTDHPPFMKIPESWPRWLTGDQVADFLEHYGQMMGLDVQFDSQVTSVEYDKASRRYTVQLRRGDWTTTLSPRHVVLATGVYSDEPVVPDFPGSDSFTGQLYHSSKHVSAQNIPAVEGKKVVVVGAGTSGHDIAQDFVKHGAKEVSMVQRQPVFFLSAEACEFIQLFLWKMDGVTTEEADLLGNATPLAVIRTYSLGMTKMMAEQDKELIAGLTKAGMALKTTEDGYGLADYQLILGGHYYLDQGASQMIVDGRIKLHRCEDGVKNLRSDGLTLADGTELDADIIVLATGYRRNILTVERLMGADVAKKLGDDFGILDQENERSGWWRPTGQPGFWYMTGSFMWCRQYSLPLALQIAAIEKGLNDAHYQE